MYLSKLHVDHFGPVDRTYASKKYVPLVVDAFTKFVKLYAVKTTTSRRFDVSRILALIVDQRYQIGEPALLQKSLKSLRKRLT